MVSLVLLLAVSSGHSIDQLIGLLTAEDAWTRDYATRELVLRGAKAADALEAREFHDPEAALRVRDILMTLRAPRARIMMPPVVENTDTTVLVEFVIENRRPAAVTVEPLFLPRPEAPKHMRVNPRWRFTFEPIIGGLPAPLATLRKPVVVKARSEASIYFPVRVNLKGRREFKLRIRYRGSGFELAAEETVRVGKQSLRAVQRNARSANEAARSRAIQYIRYRYRQNKGSQKPFQDLLRSASHSPYRDVRIGVADAIADVDRGRNSAIIEIAFRLAADRDARVARAGVRAARRVLSPTTGSTTTFRLVARTMAKADPRENAWLFQLIGTWDARQRRYFDLFNGWSYSIIISSSNPAIGWCFKNMVKGSAAGLIR